MTDFLARWAGESPEHERLLAEERLITQVTESLWEAMDNAGINKTELAARLGKSKGYVSQLFSGSRNMTLRTLAEICFALDTLATVSIRPNKQRDGWQTERVPLPAAAPGRVRYERTGNVCSPINVWKRAA